MSFPSSLNNNKKKSQTDLLANTGENKYLMSKYMVFKTVSQISPLAHALGVGVPAFQDVICRRLTVRGQSLCHRSVTFFCITDRWIVLGSVLTLASPSDTVNLRFIHLFLLKHE